MSGLDSGALSCRIGARRQVRARRLLAGANIAMLVFSAEGGNQTDPAGYLGGTT
jgi:hypothetical protein